MRSASDNVRREEQQRGFDWLDNPGDGLWRQGGEPTLKPNRELLLEFVQRFQSADHKIYPAYSPQGCHDRPNRKARQLSYACAEQHPDSAKAKEDLGCHYGAHHRAHDRASLAS